MYYEYGIFQIFQRNFEKERYNSVITGRKQTQVTLMWKIMKIIQFLVKLTRLISLSVSLMTYTLLRLFSLQVLKFLSFYFLHLIGFPAIYFAENLDMKKRHLRQMCLLIRSIYTESGLFWTVPIYAKNSNAYFEARVGESRLFRYIEIYSRVFYLVLNTRYNGKFIRCFLKTSELVA